MKKKRHAKILELISREDIETQEELQERLKEAGFPVTQATISRDIRELKLTKAHDSEGRMHYRYKEEESSRLSEKYVRVLREGLVSLTAAQNILVLKTVSGMAMAIAASLDALELKEVTGCIAGDDTIFCVSKTQSDTAVLLEKIEDIRNA